MRKSSARSITSGSFESFVAGLNKKHGAGSARFLTDTSAEGVDVLPTGCPAIDIATGCGGLPRGRIVEIFGPEASGKTTLCLTAIAEAQKRGEKAVYIDAEQALNPAFAKVIGVDLEQLLLVQPDSAEQALQIATECIRSGFFSIVAIDSVPAMVPEEEREADMSDNNIARRARLMSKFIMNVGVDLRKTNTILILINQIRQKIGGTGYGPSEVTPGGLAIKFQASMRFDIRRVGYIKDSGGEITGVRTRIRIKKNKVGTPYTTAEFDILFTEGISKIGSIIDLALEHKLIAKNGAWYSYNGEQIGHGKDAVKNYLMEHPNLTSDLVNQIRQKVMRTAGGALLMQGSSEVDEDEAEGSDVEAGGEVASVTNDSNSDDGSSSDLL